MKKITIATCLIGLSVVGFAQEKEQKEIKKEINIEMNDDGKKTMTITTIVDGNTTVEILTGEEAETYMEKMHHQDGQRLNRVHKIVWIDDGDLSEEIEIEHLIGEVNGQQRIIIKECHLDENDDTNFVFEYEMVLEEMKIAMEEMEQVRGEKAVLMHRIHEDENTKVLHEDKVYTNVEDVAKLLEELGIEYNEKGGSAKKVTVKKIVIIEEEEGEKHEFEAKQIMKTEAGEMNFYPNPNTGKFTLDFGTSSKKKAKITVVDANGKEIYNESVKGDQQYSLPIDISKESKGLYIIKIQQGDQIRARKVLVE